MKALKTTLRTDHTPEGQFWEWFQENEERLYGFEREQDLLSSELLDRLHMCSQHLTFEMSSVRDGRREFVVSAGGIKDGFPAVHALADAAPLLARWIVVRFRQRKDPGETYTVHGLTLSTASAQFMLAPARGKADVKLYLPGYNENDRSDYVTIGFLLLDALLGEYDVETKVGRIDFFPLESAGGLPVRPLTRLPEIFDALFAGTVL